MQLYRAHNSIITYYLSKEKLTVDNICDFAIDASRYRSYKYHSAIAGWHIVKYGDKGRPVLRCGTVVPKPLHVLRKSEYVQLCSGGLHAGFSPLDVGHIVAILLVVDC